MRLAERDISELSSDPVFQKAVNQALTDRLVEKLAKSNQVLNSQEKYRLKADSTELKIIDGLVEEYLESRGLVMTKSVLESEANLKYGLRKEELQGSIKAWQAGAIASKRNSKPRSTLEEAVWAGLTKLSKVKEVGIQAVQSKEAELDYQLMKIERDFLEKDRVERFESSNQKTNSLAKEYARLKREFEAEMEQRERIFKDREISKMREKERARYDSKLQEIQLKAEKTIKDKLRVLRERESEIKVDAEEQKKNLEGLRIEVQRKLMTDLSNLDNDRTSFEQEKQREYLKFKNLDYKLDKRELDLFSREKFLETHEKLSEEALQYKNEALLHSYKEKSNLEEKGKEMLDGLMRRKEELEARLIHRDKEVEELLQEVKRRDIENHDRFNQMAAMRDENVKLKELLTSHVELSKKKDVTLKLYERRIESLVDENIKVKDSIQEVKKNWILFREARVDPTLNDNFKPII